MFSSLYIVDAKLVCSSDKDSELIFIGSLLSTEELNSTDIRDTLLREYLLLGATVNVAGQMIKINNYCSAVVVEEETYHCQAALTATIAPSSGNDPLFIGIGVGMGLLVILLLLGCIIVTWICFSRRRLRSKYMHNLTIP